MSAFRTATILLRSVVKVANQTVPAGRVNSVDASISVVGGTHDMHFEPVRRRASDDAEEWYVHCDKPMQVAFYLRFVSSRSLERLVIPRFKLNSPLRVSVIEIRGSVHEDQRYQLTGGSIRVELGTLNNSLWSRIIAKLWPTNRFQDITHLLLEPSGVHFQGLLPEGFYPDRNPRPVVLRVPRTHEDFVSPDETPRRPELGNRLIWRLTSHRFEGVADNSQSLVTQTVDSMASFELPPATGREALTFIDSSRPAPGEDCEIQLFSEVTVSDGSRRLDWLATEIDTSLNLGGAGTTEGTFAPRTLYGTAESSEGGVDRTVRLETLRESAHMRTPPKISLQLMANGDVTPQGMVDLQAIANPAGAANRDNQDPNMPQFRSWICTTSGWAALESIHKEAVIDPDKVTQGPVLGALELGKLINKLRAGRSDSTALAVQTQTLRSSDVQIVFKDPQSTPQSLELSIVDPMTTLVTPPVFYREPPAAGGPPDAEGAPQSTVPSLTSGAGLKGDLSEDALRREVQELESQVRGRFESATFVSTNVTKQFLEGTDPPVRVQALETTVDFSGALGSQMQLRFGAPSIVLWSRPQSPTTSDVTQFPLVRSFPWPSTQDIGAFVDANRGLLPFRLADQADFAALLFPTTTLPQPDGEPDLQQVIAGSGDWILDPRATTTRAFLPTLPGVELELTSSPPFWQYRHSVPVLDESYGEAAESRDAAKAQAPLPDGFDPTRVPGTVAFRLDSSALVGLIHPTDAHVAGDLPMSVAASPQLGGRLPRVVIEVRNHDGSQTSQHVLGRDSNVAGINLPIAVTPNTGAHLPSFSVVLGSGAGSPAYDDHLRRNGQPLLAALDTTSGHVRTHDGLGRIVEQSASPLLTSRTVGNNAISVQLTESAAINDELILDLIGVDILDQTLASPSVASGVRAQSWALRAKNGGPAKLAGFPLRPLKLRTPVRTPEGIQAIIEAELLCRSADADDAGEGLVVLTLEQPTGQAWRVIAIEGKIDWRFPAQDGGVSGVGLTRLRGTIAAGQTRTDLIDLDLDQVELMGPTGFLDAQVGRACTLFDGRLDVPQGPAVVPPTTAGFQAFVGAFQVKEGNRQSPTLSSTDLFWTLVDGSNNRRGQLSLRSGLWSFSLASTADNETLVELPLDALLARPGSVLLHSRNDGTALATPNGCWFDRRANDFAVLAARFDSASELGHLGGEVLLYLVGKPANTQVEAQLGVSLRLDMGANIAIATELSGELALTNQIGLKHGTAAAAHTVVLTMDHSPWPLESLFFGQGPSSDPVPTPSICTHRLQLGDSDVNWTLPQPVTLRTAANYSNLYLESPVADESLVVDAGWVFLLAEPKNSVARGDQRGTVELELPRIGSHWRLLTASFQELTFDGLISHLVRFPMACAGPAPTVSFPDINLDGTGVDLVLPVAGAQMPQPTPVRLDEADAESVSFVRRGPLAYWFDPAALAGLFTEVDKDLLPAFENERGNASNKLPEKISDLNWLLPPQTPVIGRIHSASFRSPYIPLERPQALTSSTLVAFPFHLSTQASVGGPATGTAALQLLAAGKDRLQRLASKQLELDDDSGTAEIRWARDVLSARRRDEGALILSEFTNVLKVGRQFTPGRCERPLWSTAPIAKPADGAVGTPPSARTDRRLRAPSGPIRLLPKPTRAITVFAGWPEPAVDVPDIKSPAATRLRLAVEEGGALQDAQVTTASTMENPPFGIVAGALQTLTKANDVAFAVSDPTSTNDAWELIPRAESEVWALRNASPATIPPLASNSNPGPIHTVRPPLVDIVDWARRPGELTRSTLFEEQLDFTVPDSPIVSLATPHELTLRRPRAQAGPDEAVRLEVVHSVPVVRNTIQYARFRLIQRIARTPVPEATSVYAVLSGKSDIFESSASVDEAKTTPAILRVEGSEVERANLTLVADKLYVPRVNFPNSNLRKTRTILIANDGTIPSPIPKDDLVAEDIRILDDLLDDSKHKIGLPAAVDSSWQPLGSRTFGLVVEHERLAALHALLRSVKSAVVLLLQYSRDDPTHDWTAPDQPLAAIYVAALDANREFVKPKMGMAVLHGQAADPAGYRLAGFGRLEDDDFAPIVPEPANADQVSWSRTANVQSLDRLDSAARAAVASNPRDCPYHYDVVLYGPGGELIPTEG